MMMLLEKKILHDFSYFWHILDLWTEDPEKAFVSADLSQKVKNHCSRITVN